MSDDAKRTQLMEKIARDLADQGLLVEGGWQIFRLIALKPETPTPELDRCKEAFFAGAQHLFGSITFSMLEPGADETEADLSRMEQISEELNRFGRQLQLKYGRSMGSA